MDAYVVHYVRHEPGLSEAMLRELQALADDLGAAYAEYVPPNGFLVVFPSTSDGKDASGQFSADVNERIHSRTDWREIRVSAKEGPLVVDADGAGNLISRPIGLAIYEVLMSATKED